MPRQLRSVAMRLSRMHSGFTKEMETQVARYSVPLHLPVPIIEARVLTLPKLPSDALQFPVPSLLKSGEAVQSAKGPHRPVGCGRPV